MLDWLPKGGRCMEVGVYKGAFSDQIYRRVQPVILWLVDSWVRVNDDPVYKLDPTNLSTEKHTKNSKLVRKAFSGRGNVAVFRARSVDFAKVVQDESFDFIYLDAAHSSKFISEDLKAWWPKVRPGRILAGHDYLDPTPEAPWIEVKPVVDDFLKRNGLELEFVTQEKFPSWGVRKPA